MRFVVAIVAIPGALGVAYLGFRWNNDSRRPEAIALRKTAEDPNTKDTQQGKEAREAIVQVDRLVFASDFLMVAAALGAVGALLALGRQKRLAGQMLLGTGLVPAVLAVLDPKAL